MLVIVLDLQLHMQSVPIITNVVSSNNALRRGVLDTTLCDSVSVQVDGFLRVLRFPPLIKLTATI
jgi:hypothetical protein